jgi:hypothetical protein
MSRSPNSDYKYQVGGSLDESHSTYVKRRADSVFRQKLKQGTYCYVLNSRQMGKSSLRVRTMRSLQSQGFACASIEMREICSYKVTEDEFYGGFITVLEKGFLENGFNLEINVKQWWDNHVHMSPSMRLGEFIIREVLLEKITQKIVIFIDEIDNVLNLEFRDDFFAIIRSCCNKRADRDTYNRLTFALLGVATPADLIKDVTSSSFNIKSEAIELTGFELNQTMPLEKGLEGKVSNSKAVMKEVLEWTGGQPFLTQQLCKLILDYNCFISTNQEAQCVEDIVRKQIIENWQVRDEQQLLKTIQERILNRENKPSRLLKLYQKILEQGEIVADNSPEHMQLRLSGLVVQQEGKLKVYNNLYKEIFDQTWINNKLTEYRNLDDDLSSQEESRRRDQEEQESSRRRDQKQQEEQERSRRIYQKQQEEQESSRRRDQEVQEGKRIWEEEKGVFGWIVEKLFVTDLDNFFIIRSIMRVRGRVILVSRANSSKY